MDKRDWLVVLGGASLRQDIDLSARAPCLRQLSARFSVRLACSACFIRMQYSTSHANKVHQLRLGERQDLGFSITSTRGKTIPV